MQPDSLVHRYEFNRSHSVDYACHLLAIYKWSLLTHVYISTYIDISTCIVCQDCSNNNAADCKSLHTEICRFLFNN